MRPITIDVARSVVCVSVCMLGTPVSSAKTDESIEMSFGMQTPVDPRNHALDRGAHCRHLENTVEPSVRGNDTALSQITLTSRCFHHHYLLFIYF